MRRTRNAILEALERFRAYHSGVSVLHVMAFLYICENEGLNISELAHLCGTTRPTASRVARSLSRTHVEAGGVAHGLIERRQNPDDVKGRVLFLTEPGRQLRRELEAIIQTGRPIALAT